MREPTPGAMRPSWMDSLGFGRDVEERCAGVDCDCLASPLL
jgi:hypothetical protein